nr:MAG TPA: hypothetical protein [Caudoviricetes sp.]
MEARKRKAGLEWGIKKAPQGKGQMEQINVRDTHSISLNTGFT